MARKILLADDSVTAQNMGRKILADAGYDVLTVNNGSAALKRIAESKPDLIILDVYMPGYSGLEVCQRLKDSSETAHIPVLLSVGKLEPFKPQEARRVRADAHIVKPFEASELLAALGHLETCIVPPAHRPGFCAPISNAADENKEESCKDKGKDKEEPANTDNDNGRKSGVRSASAKKKKEEPEPPTDDGVATFRDFRKAGGQPVADSALEMPQDITKEEMDALSAVAARLDESIPAPHSSPSPKEEAAALSKSPSSQSTSANLEPLQNHAPLSEMTRGITKEELDALSAVAARLSDSNLGTKRIASTAEEATPPEAAGLAAQTAQSVGNLEQPQMPVVAPSLGMTEETVDTLATAWNEVEGPNGQVEAAPEISTAGEQGSQVESLGESTREVPVSNAVNAGQFADEPAPIDRNDEPMFASAVADTPAPSDEEVAAALSLLTPANGHSAMSSDGMSLATGPADGPHWTAETVGLTPEEAGMSLEAEMFRTFAGDPVAGDPVEDVESAAPVDEASPTTPAAESAPAIAAQPVELASEETPKAMAAAAAAAESLSAGSEESDIANIVDRVLADLRPKIVEEIAKKLGKK
ncbi:MAG: response regulator [Terriglobales bacterium]